MNNDPYCPGGYLILCISESLNGQKHFWAVVIEACCRMRVHFVKTSRINCAGIL